MSTVIDSQLSGAIMQAAKYFAALRIVPMTTKMPADVNHLDLSACCCCTTNAAMTTNANATLGAHVASHTSIAPCRAPRCFTSASSLPHGTVMQYICTPCLASDKNAMGIFMSHSSVLRCTHTSDDSIRCGREESARGRARRSSATPARTYRTVVRTRPVLGSGGRGSVQFSSVQGAVGRDHRAGAGAARLRVAARARARAPWPQLLRPCGGGKR